LPEYKGDIKTNNHVVKFKNSSTYSWFTFTLEETQTITFYNKNGISRFMLLNNDLSKIDYWSSKGKIKLKKGTYFFMLSTKDGGKSFFNFMYD